MSNITISIDDTLLKIDELTYLFKNNTGKVGKITWTRDELHER